MLKQIVGARGHKAPDAYFNALADKIKEVCGMPKSWLEQITTTNKDVWSPDTVAFQTIPRGKKADAAEELVIRSKAKLEDAGITIDLHAGWNDKCLLSMPMDEVAKLVPPEPTYTEENPYRGFWATSAYDYRNTYVAYGVDVDPDDKTNLKRVAENIGSKHFYEFSTGAGRRFSSYGALKHYLQDAGVRDVVSEEKLVEWGYDERFAVAQI